MVLGFVPYSHRNSFAFRLLFLGLLVSLLIFSPSVSEARVVRPKDSVQPFHETGVNGTANIWGLQSSAFVLGVAVGKSGSNFPLSVLLLQREVIGQVRVIDSNGDLRRIPLLVSRLLVVTFEGIGYSTGDSIMRNNLQDGKFIPLSGADWKIVLANNSSVSYSLAATTSVRGITVGFRFNLSLLEASVREKSYYVISGDLRQGRDSLSVSLISRESLVRSVDFKIDQFMEFPFSVSRSAIIFRLRALFLADPSLKFLARYAGQFNDTLDVNDVPTGNETVPRKKPLSFGGKLGVASSFGWVPSATIDGAEKPVSVSLFDRSARSLRFSWRNHELVGTSIGVRGLFLFPAGKSIYHDPNVYLEVRVPENVTEVIEFNSLQFKAQFMALGFVSVLLLIGIVFRKKSS